MIDHDEQGMVLTKSTGQSNGFKCMLSDQPCPSLSLCLIVPNSRYSTIKKMGHVHRLWFVIKLND